MQNAQALPSFLLRVDQSKGLLMNIGHTARNYAGSRSPRRIARGLRIGVAERPRRQLPRARFGKLTI